MSPLGFSFSLVFPRLGAEQAGSLEMPMESDFKKPQQEPALSSHRTRKGQPSKRETFYTKLLYSRQTLQEKLWPHATNASKGWVGSRTTTLPRLQWGSLTPPAGWCPKARYGATVPVRTCGHGVWEAGHRDSHPGPAVQGTALALALGVHGSSAGSLGFHLTQQSRSSAQKQRRVKQEI